MCVCAYVCMCVCMHVHICMYMCVRARTHVLCVREPVDLTRYGTDVTYNPITYRCILLDEQKEDADRCKDKLPISAVIR